MYGRIVDLPIEDMRRQMDINYWGQVYGSRVAVRYLRERGGAIINVGSVLSDRAIPLQGNYCAAKHAVKAFTDALRMELEEAGVPISVSLIKPASIDTPFFEKARTYLGVEPQPVPPVYAPVAHDGGERGRAWTGHTRRSSVYTWSMLNPMIAAACVGTAIAAAAFALRRV